MTNPTKAELKTDIANLEVTLADLQAKLAKMPEPEAKPIAPDVEDFLGDPENLAAARSAYKMASEAWSARNKAIEDSRSSLKKQVASVDELLRQKRVLLNGADALAKLHLLATEFAQTMVAAEAIWAEMELCGKALSAIGYPAAGQPHLNRYDWKDGQLSIAVQLRPEGVTVYGNESCRRIKSGRQNTPGIVAIEPEQQQSAA